MEESQVTIAAFLDDDEVKTHIPPDSWRIIIIYPQKSILPQSKHSELRA